jgi:hypothetical protein
MPHDTDQPTEAKVIPLHDQTWRDDYLRITGEPYSLRGWLSRMHPDGVVYAIRDLVRGVVAGRIDMVYRIRAASGEYHKVRAQVRRVGNEWVGVINCLGRKDSATPATIARHLVRSVRNSLAPFLCLLPFLEFLL